MIVFLLCCIVCAGVHAKNCKGNLVIGLALYPTWDDLEVAISTVACSVAATGMSGDPDVLFAVMISKKLVDGENGAARMAYSEQRYGYKAMPVAGPVNRTHLMIYRFKELLALLQSRSQKFCNVMTMDLRDSIFQSNPFKGLHRYLRDTAPDNDIDYADHGDYILFSREGLTLYDDGREAVTFVDSGANTFWFMNQCWGDWMRLERKAALTEPISCAGVTVGSHNGMVEYLTIMATLWEMFPHCAVLEEGMSRSQGGLDQGTHNVVVHLLLENFTVPVFFPKNTENGVVFTMGLVAKHFYQPHRFVHRDKQELRRYAFDEASFDITLEATATKPAVVHQYDRDKHVLTRIAYDYPAKHHCKMPYRGFRFWLDTLVARYLSQLAIW